MTDFPVTPYRICSSLFIKVYGEQRQNLSPKDNGKICLFILDIIRQSEYSFKELCQLIGVNCSSNFMKRAFEITIDEAIKDINKLFELVKQMRGRSNENAPNIDDNSVAGLYLRKIAIYFERLTHQACSALYDDLIVYTSQEQQGVRRRGLSFTLQTPRTTRSSCSHSDSLSKNVKPIHQIHHEIARLQANEQCALNPKELYESLRRPTNSSKSDSIFLRYLNLLRVNESVGSKHLLMAYFDMVSDTVPRSYSALNYAIWYLHHGEYKRAIECIQECYCCAQAADDDKCLLIALMWLAKIVIQAKEKNSSKYNVTALLDLVRKRSHKANMPYVQAMSSLFLEQLSGPVDDSEALKKSSATLKQVVLNNHRQNHLLTNMNQPNPLDKDDILPSAEVMAVRNSMNDVLAMHYALFSAHLTLVDSDQSAALASQLLLHFDLIEKCGTEDVLMVNENIFIVIRNLAYHVWNTTRDIKLVREILVDLCSSKIPGHRTDNHSIWRQALSEISFEHYVEQENWCAASKMISVIRETDFDGAQLRQAELLKTLGSHDEALHEVEDLISRIDCGESNLSAFIKSKALLLRATLLDDETKVLESLQFASQNRFLGLRSECLKQLSTVVT